MKTQIRISGKDVDGFLLEDHFNLAKGQTWRDIPNGDALFAATDGGWCLYKAKALPHPVTVHVLRFIVEDGTWVFGWWTGCEVRESLLVPRIFVKATEQGGDEEEDAHWGTLHGVDDKNIAGTKGTGVEYCKRPHRIEEQDVWQRECRGAEPAEAARAKMPTKRKPGPGRKPYYDDAEIKRVESTITEQGGSIKAAAEVLKMPYQKAAAIHEAARKRRGRKA